ncbi:MAG TPA: hypothetical protein VMM38_05585 [Aridibacter sp.]|nr:hypothetical protein [Aridibacter sp.]
MSLRRFRFAAALCAVSSLFAVPAIAKENTKELADRAVSDDPAIAQPAVETLRKMGYEGFDALLLQYKDLIDAHLAGKADPSKWQKAAYAFDKVARQKDAWASGLYWHTDLAEAKAEAARNGKPMISLRLLGNLDEELSCANSRFFRSILYTDDRLKKTMREDFVLHWQSERPAPVMTVDFGDGRKLVTTVTGNSIHYVLAPDGRIIDALPGLYSPEFFANYLSNFPSLLRRMSRPAGRPVEAHRNRIRNFLLTKWRSDLLKLGADPSKVPTGFPNVLELSGNGENPTAIEAAPRAVTKMVAEATLLQPTRIQKETLAENTLNEHWKALAESFGYRGISDESKSFVRRKYDPTGSKSDRDFAKMIDRLVESVALDTVQNAYLFHTQILEWLNDGDDQDLGAFNLRIYSELFLTPASDPWLGLYSDNVFLGVEANGVIPREH